MLRFLSFLFFCGVCISTFGQELQSPQISQNAIFANPGLAGSKGQTRVCGSMGRLDFNKFDYSYQDSISSWSGNGKNQITNGAFSVDGLAFKKSIGFGAYAKFNTYGAHRNYSYRNDTLQRKYYSEYLHNLTYSNIETGIMIAPKFYLSAKSDNKNNKSISPSISIGIRGQFANINDYESHVNTSLSPMDSIVTDNRNYRNIELSHVSFGFLYSTKKGYSGLNLSFIHNDEGGFYYKPSFLFAHTFSNKKKASPNFSFTPQFYLGISIVPNKLYRYNRGNYRSPYHVFYESNYALNLDFRYKIIIFGLYSFQSSWYYYSTGYTLGAQLKNTRVVLNVSPSFSKRSTGTEFFLSANFLLKPKQKLYR